MKMHEKELKVLENMFMHASGQLQSFVLPKEEVLALLEEPEFDKFTPEFRNWVCDQFDQICLEQGQ